ncbi:MAG: hypothetical protein WB687_09870, partial [Candidatus Cybelea sp.]
MRRTNWRHDGPIEALAQVLARLLDAAITGFGLFRRHYPVNVLFTMAVRHGVECRSLGFRHRFCEKCGNGDAPLVAVKCYPDGDALASCYPGGFANRTPNWNTGAVPHIADGRPVRVPVD